MSEDLKRKTGLLVHSSELFMGYCLLNRLKAKHKCVVSVVLFISLQQSTKKKHSEVKRAPATESCDTTVKNNTKYYIIFMMDENRA